MHVLYIKVKVTSLATVYDILGKKHWKYYQNWIGKNMHVFPIKLFVQKAAEII